MSAEELMSDYPFILNCWGTQLDQMHSLPFLTPNFKFLRHPKIDLKVLLQIHVIIPLLRIYFSVMFSAAQTLHWFSVKKTLCVQTEVLISKLNCEKSNVTVIGPDETSMCGAWWRLIPPGYCVQICFVTGKINTSSGKQVANARLQLTRLLIQ